MSRKRLFFPQMSVLNINSVIFSPPYPNNVCKSICCSVISDAGIFKLVSKTDGFSFIPKSVAFSDVVL